MRARQRGAARIPVQLLELSGALEPVENAYYVNMLGNLESMRPRSVICIGALRKVSLRVCT